MRAYTVQFRVIQTRFVRYDVFFFLLSSSLYKNGNIFFFTMGQTCATYVQFENCQLRIRERVNMVDFAQITWRRRRWAKYNYIYHSSQCTSQRAKILIFMERDRGIFHGTTSPLSLSLFVRDVAIFSIALSRKNRLERGICLQFVLLNQK